MNEPVDWLLLDSGPGSAPFNMAMDEALMLSMPILQKPVLRFYSWTQPAASFGYFQKYAEVEKATLLRPLVRRPTAGGIVPHDRDWTYSLAFHDAHEWSQLRAIESYRRVHEWLRQAFQQLGVTTELAPTSRKTGAGQCFVGYEMFDLLWHGQKIAGAAQRRNRNGLLIQGSCQSPPTGTLSHEKWRDAMLQTARQNWQVNWVNFGPDSGVMARAHELERDKYSQATFNKKR
jgi:lipoate-protein ligase A